ncbi:uncharacterized protein EMH_0097220 [Eimeria mitis]|uniref:Uncharacterized protein n=1 Tax=Eimeria mitis TaxID=44415 RepID=U6KFZ3_9EIME|nr:uncharacterized protein EMH_0097220 [Eimeria mitis]CDJ36839.1 hypothetical protein EMH_0097220 [Eimeria mitis]
MPPSSLRPIRLATVMRGLYAYLQNGAYFYPYDGPKRNTSTTFETLQLAASGPMWKCFLFAKAPNVNEPMRAPNPATGLPLKRILPVQKTDDVAKPKKAQSLHRFTATLEGILRNAAITSHADPVGNRHTLPIYAYRRTDLINQGDRPNRNLSANIKTMQLAS